MCLLRLSLRLRQAATPIIRRQKEINKYAMREKYLPQNKEMSVWGKLVLSRLRFSSPVKGQEIRVFRVTRSIF